MKRHIVSFAAAAFFALGVSTVWAQGPTRPSDPDGGRGVGGGAGTGSSGAVTPSGGGGTSSGGGSSSGSAVSTSSGSTGGGGSSMGWGNRPGVDFPRSSAPLRGPDAAAVSNDGGQSRARGSGSGSGSGGSRAAPRGEGGSGQGRAVPRGEGAGSGQGRAVPRGEGAGSGQGRAVPRGEGGEAAGRGAPTLTMDGGAREPQGRTRSAVPEYSRPREGRTPVGSPVDRTEIIRRGGGIGTTWYYDSFYGYPYGGYRYYNRYGWYPGYGFGLGYMYDPFWYGAGYGSYGGYGGYYGSGGGGYYGSRGYDTGSLRLKVQPRDAKVYVDGYFVGLVDSFDGVFQKLAVEAGTHRVEIRADGYEPAQFEIIMTPGETITYKGELKRITP